MIDCTPSPDNCGTNQGCHIITMSGESYGDCIAAGTSAASDSCAVDTDCVAGTTCLTMSNGGGSGCVEPCRTAADCANLNINTCDTNMGWVVDGVDYGVCFAQ